MIRYPGNAVSIEVLRRVEELAVFLSRADPSSGTLPAMPYNGSDEPPWATEETLSAIGEGGSFVRLVQLWGVGETLLRPSVSTWQHASLFIAALATHDDVLQSLPYEIVEPDQGALWRITKAFGEDGDVAAAFAAYDASTRASILGHGRGVNVVGLLDGVRELTEPDGGIGPPSLAESACSVVLRFLAFQQVLLLVY